MIISAYLLNSEIFEIQDVWTGQEDLQYTNDALKTLPKGLWFFCPVSPLELHKVMGLEGIHHLDAFCCFASVTFCPWCSKEGQNEGTIVNNLQTTHNKLGLVCEKCLHCSATTLEAIQHHSQGHKQPKECGREEEDRGLNDTSLS